MACVGRTGTERGKERPCAASEGLTCVTYKERKGTQGNNKQRGHCGNVDTWTQRTNVDNGGLWTL